jgi:hypothetical protein
VTTRTVNRVRVLALGLSLFDAVLGIVLASGDERIPRALGEQPGFSANWGVGQLLGYAAVEAYTAIRPSSEALFAVAALRAVAAPADLAAARTSRRGLKYVLRAVAGFNAGAVLAFVHAGRQLRLQRPRCQELR